MAPPQVPLVKAGQRGPEGLAQALSSPTVHLEVAQTVDNTLGVTLLTAALDGDRAAASEVAFLALTQRADTGAAHTGP